MKRSRKREKDKGRDEGRLTRKGREREAERQKKRNRRWVGREGEGMKAGRKGGKGKGMRVKYEMKRRENKKHIFTRLLNAALPECARKVFVCEYLHAYLCVCQCVPVLECVGGVGVAVPLVTGVNGHLAEVSLLGADLAEEVLVMRASVAISGTVWEWELVFQGCWGVVFGCSWN